MIRVLAEGERRAKSDWMSLLACTSADLDLLLQRRVLHEDKEGCSLRFVGIFVLHEAAWYCRPALDAYPDGRDLLQQIERVDRVFRTYEGRSRGRHPFKDPINERLLDDHSAEQVVRQIDLLASLFGWTESYGFHRSVNTRKTSGSWGRMDWPATIGEGLPIRTKTGVFHSDPVSASTFTELSALGILQARALMELFHTYEEVALITFRDAREFLDEARAILAEGTDAEFGFIPDFLWESFGATNKDHDKELIRVLLAYFGGGPAVSKGVEPVYLYGSLSFYLVWEDMCRSALDVSSKEGEFSNPIYETRTGKFATDKQLPDIVLREDGVTYILDAKYYPRFPLTLPGLEDVRKQLFYGQSHSSSEVRLAFIIPGKSEKTVETAGTVSMFFCATVDSRFSTIQCIFLDWQSVVEAYAARTPLKGLRKRIVKLIEASSCVPRE